LKEGKKVAIRGNFFFYLSPSELCALKHLARVSCQERLRCARATAVQPELELQKVQFTSITISPQLLYTQSRRSNVISLVSSSSRSTMAPTPESASFLAKKPTVPPTFDGVDYDDTKRLKQAQDAVIREQWVKSMMARLVREELGKCYYKEGVNHLEKCGALRGVYILSFREKTMPIGMSTAVQSFQALLMIIILTF